MTEKENIRELLEDALPLVDFDSDFLFSELDSLGVTTIPMVSDWRPQMPPHVI